LSADFDFLDRMTSPFLLASASPRRKELLEKAGFSFEIQPADIVERRKLGETPQDYANRLAWEKAERVAGANAGRWVLAADTIVIADPGTVRETILGKPNGAAEATRMLEHLSASSHRVVTAVALARVTATGLESQSFTSTATVTFRALRPDEIEDYIASGEPLDKAGAYAIQGGAAGFVASFEGSWSAIVGLPMEETVQALSEIGITPG
jgi:septum formation protein